ncbi:hypothetical protein D3Z87_05965 [Bacillus subtilis]|uniref:hypothetical protein n=1 Tax=Bacillus subtilis TaxID=1423 RepID=UPI000E744CF0|nr:hypothetical protein D3Z87_05965 [Bacillus subtilis]
MKSNNALIVILGTVTLDAVGIGLVMPVLPGLLRDTNYRFDVGQAVYAPGTLIYVFEIIDGWCRIYWNNHNEWIWHERLIVKEVF